MSFFVAEDALQARTYRYADGEPRPRLRGFVHAAGIVLIPIAIFVLTLLLPQQTHDQLRELVLLNGFLAGKFVSYATSAFLHRSASTSIYTSVHRKATQIDYVAVNVSILAAAIPTAYHHPAMYYGTAGACIAVASVVSVLDWNLARLVVTLAQFVSTVVFIGYTTFWNGIWIVGSVTYMAAFACFGPVAAREGKGPELKEALLPVPWHKIGQNGCHEDFHNLLFVADVLYFVNAIVHGAHCR